MEYPLQELKNLITDRIHENHERAITGVDLQEFLHDILDSLSNYTDGKVVEPAVNFYTESISFDPATGAITLVRTGGITPVDISTDLDGRYRLISESDIRSDTVTVPAGLHQVEFRKPFPLGADYSIPPVIGIDANGEETRQTPFNFLFDRFSVNFDIPVTFTYQAIIKQ